MAAPMRAAGSDSPALPAVVYQEIDDDIYKIICSAFLAVGRGRRPSLPPLRCTNKVQLQIYAAKEHGSCTWKETERFFVKVFPDCEENAARHILQKAVQQVQACENVLAREKFYPEIHDFNYVCVELSSLGVGKKELLDPTLLVEKLEKTSQHTFSFMNSHVIALETFRRKRKLPVTVMSQWFETFLPCSPSEIQDTLVKKFVSQIYQQYGSLNKAKKKYPEKLALFKATKVSLSSVSPSAAPQTCKITYDGVSNTNDDVQNTNDDVSNTNDDVPNTSASEQLIINDQDTVTPQTQCKHLVQIRTQGCEIKKLKSDLQCQAGEISEVETERDHLKQLCKETNLELEEAKTDHEILKEKVYHLKKQTQELQANLKVKDDTIKGIKRTNYYKKLQRKDYYLESKKSKAVPNNEDLLNKIGELQKSVKQLRKNIDKVKRRKAEQREQKLKLQKQLVTEKQRNTELESLLTHSINTKVENNKFSEDIVKCVIELMGEAEVAAKNSAKVIQIVSKNLFKVNIHTKDLPSDRSALRFADRGHVLAKYQLAEELRGNKWDLHLDGTTKDHVKYVGSQVTLDSGKTLSSGFTHVCTEDADTLLDVAVSILKELSYVYDEREEMSDSFRQMLQNLVGLMSDRASVMKAFDRSFNTKRQEFLGTEENLEFLHCNAHFLLGLSSGAEKVLKEFEISKEAPLGRDKLSAFQRFRSSTECATSRYVRTACDTIGPRGDEKSGCRDLWEAFLHMKNSESHVSSYRSNRFNNFFQSAAALHYHRTDIVQFFTKFKQNNNLKQQSVLADAQCDDIDVNIIALGILYYRVTGPYWNLVKSDCKYLDFYHYITDMYGKLQEWTVDTEKMLSPEAEPWCGKFQLKMDHIHASLHDYIANTGSDAREKITEILKKLCGKFSEVTQRQLEDFLPGGRYHNVQDEATKKRMDHCKLTNLTGEACFGDLDYSLFKRRNASLHHHSTVNMLKRNRTMSEWFGGISKENQSRLLDLSTKLGPNLRTSHREAQKEVDLKAQKILTKNRENQEEKQRKHAQLKMSIVNTVKEHGGPITKPSDIPVILAKHTSRSAQLNVLKMEMRYIKFVLGEKSPLIRITGTLEQLKDNLQKYLQALGTGDEDSGQPSTTGVDCSHGEEPAEQTYIEHHNDNTGKSTVPPPRKRKLQDYLSDSEDDFVTSEDLENSDIEESDELLTEKVAQFGQFEFSKQGVWVAVFYDTDFYVGEVLAVENKIEGHVAFLERCGFKKSYFRWPGASDVKKIESKFIFAWGFDVVTTNGRRWEIPNLSELELLFSKYKMMYC